LLVHTEMGLVVGCDVAGRDLCLAFRNAGDPGTGGRQYDERPDVLEKSAYEHVSAKVASDLGPVRDKST
jgi:hypothetical protein